MCFVKSGNLPDGFFAIVADGNETCGRKKTAVNRLENFDAAEKARRYPTEKSAVNRKKHLLLQVLFSMAEKRRLELLRRFPDLRP